MIDLSQPEVAFALESIKTAVKLTEAVRAEMPSSALIKKDRSPVTVADFGVQAFVARRLSEHFPKDPLVAEESSSALQTEEGEKTLSSICDYVSRFLPDATSEKICSWMDLGKSEAAERFWTLDPIDGTKGFIRGDQYAVALALLEKGKVKVGVLGCPKLKLDGKTGILAVAVQSQGAWFTPLEGKYDFKPLRVSSHKNLTEAVVLRSFEASHGDTSKIGKLIEKAGIKAPAVCMDSLAKYAALAGGVGDFLVRFPSSADRHELIWDQAPGTIIVEEAGGKVSDLDGKPLDYTQGRSLKANRGVFISNGHLHETVLKALRELV